MFADACFVVDDACVEIPARRGGIVARDFPFLFVPWLGSGAAAATSTWRLPAGADPRAQAWGLTEEGCPLNNNQSDLTEHHTHVFF